MAQPIPKHIPPRLSMNVFDTSSPLSSPLTRGCWSKADISKIIVQNVTRLTLSPNDRTPMQLEALMEYWNVSNRLRQYLESEDYVDLERLFALFDRLFFGGHLSQCPLELNTQIMSVNGMSGICGVNFPYCLPPIRGLFSRILLDKSGLLARASAARNSFPSEFQRTKAGRAHRFRAMEVYADSLVHQMLHAMFISYACCCKDCIVSTSPREDGTHGEAWQDAALAIEQCRILGWNFELDRETSLVDDMGPGEKPSEKEMERQLRIQRPAIPPKDQPPIDSDSTMSDA